VRNGRQGAEPSRSVEPTRRVQRRSAVSMTYEGFQTGWNAERLILNIAKASSMVRTIFSSGRVSSPNI